MMGKRRQWWPTLVLLPGKSHGWRSLVGCSPWGRWVGHDWATSLSFSLSCIGEGNGNPLQCSCLENPRDGGAWWAAIYRVAQSQTWLKQLSSSSSSKYNKSIYFRVLLYLKIVTLVVYQGSSVFVKTGVSPNKLWILFLLQNSLKIITWILKLDLFY